MSSAASPPSIRFALAIGVTGHRRAVLNGRTAGDVEARVDAVIDLVERNARALAKREADLFADGAPMFTLVSPLADGADQIVAKVALARGFELQAILPFERGNYEVDFEPGGRARLGEYLARAKCVLELPGARSEAGDAYLQAGRATVAHCDVLIAVWDGDAARGPGGTADVVQLALARGTPVIHVPLDPMAATMILWSAFDPTIITARSSGATRRPFDQKQVERMLALILAPPADPRERADLKGFLGERDRGVRARVEYPLLLAATGTRRFRRSDWHAAPAVAATTEEWARFREACVKCHGVSAELDQLEEGFGWSDRLANHFAQNYRSGHVFNFLFAALAVLVALTGLLVPEGKIGLAVAEFGLILAIMLNTRVGVKARWHQRWLDYRQLAERLRPMRSLKLLGIAAPDPPGSAAEPVARRWIDWYAAGVWRTMGCPSGHIDRGCAQALTRAIAAQEIAPQIAYNRASAEQSERLDRRLEWLGSALFAATLTGCVVLITALIVAPDWAQRQSKTFVWLSAALPALASAIFGIRVQGDFSGSAVRSHSTADLLERIARDFEGAGSDLGRSADLAEQAARVMLADLGEWRLVNEQHELAIG